MSVYRTLFKIGERFIGKSLLFKFGFNLSPMYRRSTARLQTVSKDLLQIKAKLPLSYKNKNYMGTMFGGSMFSAVDPIPMIQLVFILGEDYVVWDKSAEIYFKRPANKDVYVDFNFSTEEINTIKERLKTEDEIEILKVSDLTNKDKSVIFCQVKKTIYIANKSFYKQKRKARQEQKKYQ